MRRAQSRKSSWGEQINNEPTSEGFKLNILAWNISSFGVGVKILFTGGGTGGHLLPIIAIARETRKIFPEGKELKFFCIGPKDDFGKILLSQEEIEVKTIMAGKIRRYLEWRSVLQNLLDIFIKIPVGFFQAFFSIFFLAPDLIFSKGGYGSLPVVFSGWILGVPIFISESDIAPGLANRVSSKFSSTIFISFSQTEYFNPKKTVFVGNPIRREILEGSKEEAKKLFNLTGEKPVILILGGSQGAQRINDKLLNILSEILQNFELIHQCGERNFDQVNSESKIMIAKDLEKYYHLYPFLKEVEIRQAYAAADLIVSRAGSSVIFEIAAWGKPSILVPLPESAQNHQVKNAYAYAAGGAAIVMEEANLTPRFFSEKLKYLFSHSEETDKMAKAAKEFSKPDAALKIAEHIADYLSL